jgi:hypothetical protein
MPDREGNFARREFLTPLDAWSLANDDEVIGFDVGNLLVSPFGQRIVRSTVLPSPRPKCRRRSFAE